MIGCRGRETHLRPSMAEAFVERAQKVSMGPIRVPGPAAMPVWLAKMLRHKCVKRRGTMPDDVELY